MTARWTVHLADAAAAVLRDLPPDSAKRVAAALDILASTGRAALDIEDEGSEWTGKLAAGDQTLVIAGRENDPRVIVVRIDADEQHAAHRAVDAIPVAPRTRRRLGSLLQGLDLDFRYTLRTLRRSPTFAAIVISTLAIAFGGSTAILDVVRTVYRGALPFHEADRLVRLRNVSTSANGESRRYNLTPRDFEILRDHGKAFDGVVAMAARSLSLVAAGSAERVSAIGVSASWAQTLGLTPVLGRLFHPDEERAGSDASVALISHALWNRRFGGDSAVVGSTLRYDGGALTIVGVMSAPINYPYDADIWTPWSFIHSAAAPSSLNIVARLAPGVSIETAQADAATLHASRVASNEQRSATGFDVATVRSDFIRDEARTVHALTAAVLFLLVLACVNVTNLFVARFSTRRRELGLRAALGGRRDQQVRQMLLESLVLFAAGAGGGLLIGNWLREIFGVTVPDNLRTDFGLDATTVSTSVILAGVALAIGIGLGVGLIAAMRAVRTDPMMLIRQGGRGNIGAGDRRVFNVLVASQLGFSLVLLVGASLLISRFRSLTSADPGYDVANVATMRITLEQDRYRTPEARLQLVRSLEERLAAIPGVAAVGITSVNPLCCGDWAAPVEVEGRPVGPDDPPTMVAHSFVTPGYFGVMKLPVIAGEGFPETDRPNTPPTVIVDQPLADMAWPGVSPIGKRIRIAREGAPWRTIVGVVPETVHEAETRASWFLPYYQEPTGGSTEQLHIMIRSPRVIPMTAITGAVGTVDPALAVYGATTMSNLQRERTAQDRLGAIVSGIFALFGLLLAGCSLYGLLSYSVELRKAEMGIRMALGARPSSIVALILKQAGARLLAGLVLGIGLALAVNQLLRGLIDGLPWVEWKTIAMLAGILTIVTATAAVVPALRATRVDPMRSLRA